MQRNQTKTSHGAVPPNRLAPMARIPRLRCNLHVLVASVSVFREEEPRDRQLQHAFS